MLATIGIAIYGVGLGFVTPSITAIVSEAFPERRAATLNLLNFSWALEAIAAPNLILAAVQHFSFQVPGMLMIYAVALVIAAFLIPRVPVALEYLLKAPKSKLPPRHSDSSSPAARSSFLYVGIEAGLAGWLPKLATRMHGFSLRRAALLQDTFWITFLVGRFCAPAFLKIIGERVVFDFVDLSFRSRNRCIASVPRTNYFVFLFGRLRRRGMRRNFSDGDRSALAPPGWALRINPGLHVCVGWFRRGRYCHFAWVRSPPPRRTYALACRCCSSRRSV